MLRRHWEETAVNVGRASGGALEASAAVLAEPLATFMAHGGPGREGSSAAQPIQLLASPTGAPEALIADVRGPGSAVRAARSVLFVPAAATASPALSLQCLVAGESSARSCRQPKNDCLTHHAQHCRVLCRGH